MHYVFIGRKIDHCFYMKTGGGFPILLSFSKRLYVLFFDKKRKSEVYVYISYSISFCLKYTILCKKSGIFFNSFSEKVKQV